MILVGDSVGMTDMVGTRGSHKLQGYSSTLPVELEDTILFCKCVSVSSIVQVTCSERREVPHDHRRYALRLVCKLI